MSQPARPGVSVIIPAYRQAEFITACLDSIAAQTYAGPIEAIVIDDGSPDDSAAVAEAHPLRPVVIRQENQGVSGARNRGIAAASYPLIAFLDADDAWLPEKLDVQVAALMAAGGRGVAFTRYRRVHPDGSSPAGAEHPSPRGEETPSRLIKQNIIGTSTVLTHRDCIAAVGDFPTRDNLLKAGQDYALWLRIAAYYPMVYVPEVLTLYMVHPNNRVGTDPLKHHSGGLNALRNFYRWAPERFEEITGTTLDRMVLWRTARLTRALITHHRVHPPGTLRRALDMAREAAR